MTKKKTRSVAAKAETSPAHSLLSDLRGLKKILRRTTDAYRARLESEIDGVALWAGELAGRDLSKARIRDLGDMITLVRKLDQESAAKGRRRDLRKIDATVKDLSEISRLKDR